MSSNNASGVRNLRAMFENKASSDQSTSPPSRGRSPLDTDNSETSRPVSKVRASFIAVEKPGQSGQPPQWGLRKASDVSSISGNITEDSSLRRVISKNNRMAENDQTGEDLGLILKGSPFENGKAAHMRQEKDVEQAASGQAQKKVPEVDTNKAKPSLAKDVSDTKMKTPSGETKLKPSTAQLPTSKAELPAKAPVNEKSGSHNPLSPESTQVGKVNTTHPKPTIRGIRGGPAKIMAVMDSANKAKMEREKKSPVLETKLGGTAKDVSKAPVTNGTKKEPTSPKTEKSAKPPTQPTKLPAAATNPTTASAARSDGPPKALHTDNRRVSAMRKDKPPPKVASTATASSLAKRTPRSSLAPQTNGHERPKSRVSTAKDENFLARMMRPTASSQQKVHEKVTKSDSPPRARKGSDKVRQSLGLAKDKGEDKENEEISPLEATKLIPEIEEQKTEIPAEAAIAQEAT